MILSLKKLAILTFLSAGFTLNLFAQTPQTTFKVCNVTDDFPYQMANDNYTVAFEARIGKGIESVSSKDYKLRKCGYHPFMESLYFSYATHKPIIISPDMIWLIIAQGFANHIDQNADSLRDMIVSFDGKQQLEVKRNEFIKGSFDNDWVNVFPEFSDSIKTYVGSDLVNNLTPQFSTTGIAEKAAFEITLMDAMSSYFDYQVTTMCGIPEITLEGTPKDWMDLRDRAQVLRKYKLDQWIDKLTPILNEFVSASNGTVNTQFWREIYKMDDGSGGPYITGWITKFFPYLLVNKEFVSPSTIRGKITSEHFTSGMSKAPFIWQYYATRYKMEFCAGFVGFQEIGPKFAIRPEIGWAIRDTGN